MTRIIEFTHAETYFFLARSYKYVWSEDTNFNEMAKLSKEELLKFVKESARLQPLYDYDRIYMQHWLWMVKVQSEFSDVTKIMDAWVQVNKEMCEEEIVVSEGWTFPNVRDRYRIDAPKYWDFLRRKADKMNNILASDNIYLRFNMHLGPLSKEQEQEEKEKDSLEKSLNPLAKK